jgi:hypothetical protein
LDPDHRHFSWLGAVLWAVVLIWLLACLVLTCRRYRALRR